MNNVSMIGSVVRIDPKTDEQAKYLRFSIAVRKPSKQVKPNDDSYYFNCVAFGKTAELITLYVSKGQKLGVCGRLETRAWTSPKDPQTKKTFYTITVSEISFIEKANKSNGKTEEEKGPIHW